MKLKEYKATLTDWLVSGCREHSVNFLALLTLLSIFFMSFQTKMEAMH